MLELKQENLRNFENHSSKGNQLKWEQNSIWYKADYAGYEGLAEFVTSSLLNKSSLSKDEFVNYDLERVKYKRKPFNTAVSSNFLPGGWQIITLQRLYQSKTGRSLLADVWHLTDYRDRLKFLVETVERMTGIENFGIYISRMLTIDAFFLNEDRHMHNIAVLMDDNGSFKLCPFFDHGAGLLSDTTLDYPLGEDVLELMTEVKAKTICEDFDEALYAAEELYGTHLKFSFDKTEIQAILDNVTIYTQDEKQRVETIIYQQMRKYQYLF